MTNNTFGWAAEIELPLVSGNGEVQFVGDLEWSRMNELLNSAFPEERACWPAKYPGHRNSPFYLEGFDHYSEGDFKFLGLQVKGVELRTDIADSAQSCLAEAVSLFDVLRETLSGEGLRPLVFGSHPSAPPFRGEQAQRSLADWKAAEVTMSTTGLHVNLSVPSDVTIDFAKVRNALNLFAPAMVLFSLNSPFLHGKVWTLPDGLRGKSSRTFLRSFYRDPIRAKEGIRGTRFHCSLFDMVPELPVLGALMELTMGALLAEWKIDPIADSVRAYNMAEVAKHGFNTVLFDGNTFSMRVEDLASELLSIATKALEKYGIQARFLNELSPILNNRTLFADRLLESYENFGSLKPLIDRATDFIGRERLQ